MSADSFKFTNTLSGNKSLNDCMEPLYSTLAGLVYAAGSSYSPPQTVCAIPDFKGENAPLSYISSLLDKKPEVFWTRQGDGRSRLSSKTSIGACRMSAIVSFGMMAKRKLAREVDISLRDIVMFVNPLEDIVSRVVGGGGQYSEVILTFRMRGMSAHPSPHLSLALVAELVFIGAFTVCVVCRRCPPRRSGDPSFETS